MEKLWIWEDFFCCLRPVIHRHHLLPLDRELWMVHQEDRQPRKIKMRHERNLGQSFLSGHSENMFSAKVAASWQPMNFAISLCAGIHNCNFDVIVVFLRPDLVWPKPKPMHFFGYPLDLRSFFTNQYSYTRTFWYNLEFSLYVNVRFFEHESSAM